jgi:hypothetical protein
MILPSRAKTNRKNKWLHKKRLNEDIPRNQEKAGGLEKIAC